MPTTLKFSKRKLPHWLVADRSYFVTIRLHGTLPKHVVEEMQEKRSKFEEENSGKENILELQRKQFRALELILDSTEEKHWLSEPDVAELILNSLNWMQQRKGWRIYAAVVMSTHVHILMRSENGRSAELLGDLGHFKRYTAVQANRILKRNGPFWAREDFDHWIRGREKFERTIRYILNNPVKAGLVSDWKKWPWSYLDETVCELI